jgi:hypothetical protein
MSSTSIWSFDYSKSLIDWLNCLIFSLHFYSLLSYQFSNQYDIEDVFYYQFNSLQNELDSQRIRRLRWMSHDRQDDDQTWWCWKICKSNQDWICRIYWARSFYLFHDKIRCDEFDWSVDRRATWSRDYARRL